MEHRILGTTGVSVPEVGQGTWNIGGGFSSSRTSDSAAVEALRLGLEVGMRLLDTAEMYGAGHREEIVGQAIQNTTEPIFMATQKFLRATLSTTAFSELPAGASKDSE